MAPWAIGLTILGGLMEMTGFLLVMRELGRVQREHFPDEPRLWDRTRAWVRRVVGRSRDATVHHASGSISIAAGGAIATGGEVRVAPTTLEERVAQLERDVLKARDDVARHREQLDNRITELHGQHEQRLADLEQHQQAMEQQRKAGLLDSVRAERRATGIFIVGVFFSVLGGVLGNV